MRWRKTSWIEKQVKYKSTSCDDDVIFSISLLVLISLSFKRLHSYLSMASLFLCSLYVRFSFSDVLSMVVMFGPHFISHLRWAVSEVFIDSSYSTANTQKEDERERISENKNVMTNVKRKPKTEKNDQCEKSFSHLHVNCYRLISNHRTELCTE